MTGSGQFTAMEGNKTRLQYKHLLKSLKYAHAQMHPRWALKEDKRRKEGDGMRTTRWSDGRKKTTIRQQTERESSVQMVEQLSNCENSVMCLTRQLSLLALSVTAASLHARLFPSSLSLPRSPFLSLSPLSHSAHPSFSVLP